ncbi:MAG: amino acid permease [Acidobacteriota bacterium]
MAPYMDATPESRPKTPKRPGEAGTNSALLRRLGVLSATALVVSNMVGTGIFTTSGLLAGDLGDPGLILVVWMVGALCALAGALCYAELGVNFPSSGGEYVYLSRAYGPTWGFMTGWVSFFAGFSAPIAAAALAFSDYLGYFFPSLLAGAATTIELGGVSLRLGNGQLAAAGLILAFTLLNCAGIGRVARVQNVLTAAKVVVILAFIVLGFAIGAGTWDHYVMPAVRTSTVPLARQVAISLFWVMFSYSGWNAATYVAEELERPERTLPRALVWGTVLVTMLYLGLNLVFMYATPLETMKGVLAVGSLAASRLFGSRIAGVFSLLMALAIASTVNAMVTIGPRVYYAMARQGAFFRFAARVHPTWRTPVPAVLSQGLCAMLLTVTPFPQLVIYIAFSLTFFTVMSVASLFVFRRQPGWRRLAAVSVAFPLIPVAFIAVGTWMILYGVMLEPKVSAAAIATIASGAALYRLTERTRARQALAGQGH